MASIGLTYSMKSNLLNLQGIANRQAIIQNRLSTGLSVSSPLDNPSSYYTAVSLSNQAQNLSALLDSMGQTVQSLKNVSKTIAAGIEYLEQAKAIAYSALEADFSSVKPPMPPPTPPPAGAKAITKTDVSNVMTDFNIAGSVVSSATELKNALNNAKAGDTIVVFGKVNVNEESIILKNGVNLVGTDTLIKDNSLGDKFYVEDTDKASVYFNFSGVGNSVGLYLESNTYVSDVFIDYHTVDKKGSSFSAVKTINKATNIMLNNIGVNVSSDSSSMVAMEAIYSSAADVNLSGTINITMNGYASKGFHGDYFGTFNQKADSVINMKLDGRDVEAFRGGMMNLYGVTNVAILTSGNLMSYGNNVIAGEVNLSFEQSNTNNILFAVNNTTFKSSAVINVISIDDVVKIIDKKAGKDTWEKGAQINYESPTTLKNWVSQSNGSFTGASSVDLATGFDMSEPPYNWKETNLFDIDVQSRRTNIQFSEIKAKKISELVDRKEKNKAAVSAQQYNNSYNSILNQYNQMIKDGSYLGVNLLREDNIKVVFNDSASSKLDILGVNMLLGSLGIDTSNWYSVGDVGKSIKQIEASIEELRLYASNFGTYYNIVSNRESFTNNMINVLNEGADKLILADINEESANMLSLQTRQQLAINSLSLASQAAQSILRLF